MRSCIGKLVILLAIVAISSPLLAQGHMHRGPHGAPHRDQPPLGRMLDHLELTEDQREQIDALIAERHEAMRDGAQQMRERRRAVAEAIHAEHFDEAAIRDAVATVAELEADQAVERARGLRDVMELLTPAQRERAREMIEQHSETAQPGGRRGVRRFHGPGPRGHHRPGGHDAPQELDD